jgi:hypothetical protein
MLARVLFSSQTARAGGATTVSRHYIQKASARWRQPNRPQHRRYNGRDHHTGCAPSRDH